MLRVPDEVSPTITLVLGLRGTSLWPFLLIRVGWIGLPPRKSWLDWPSFFRLGLGGPPGWATFKGSRGIPWAFLDLPWARLDWPSPLLPYLRLSEVRWANTNMVSEESFHVRNLLLDRQLGPYLLGEVATQQDEAASSSSSHVWPVMLDKVMTQPLRQALAREGFSACTDLTSLLPQELVELDSTLSLHTAESILQIAAKITQANSDDAEVAPTTDFSLVKDWVAICKLQPIHTQKSAFALSKAEQEPCQKKEQTDDIIS